MDISRLGSCVFILVGEVTEASLTANQVKLINDRQIFLQDYIHWVQHL